VSSLVDTHCHLNFNSFDGDRTQVLERAWDRGLVRILVPGINLTSSKDALRLAEDHEQVFVAVGVHPNDALTWNDATLDELRLMTEHPKVVAIGEIGLDYYRDWAPRDLQKRIFDEQLSLASEVDLPVVIHNRESSDDMMHILSDWHTDLEAKGSSLGNHPGVLHSFSDELKIAEQGVANNFYIGLTGPVTYKNADNLRNTVSILPLRCLLIETDAPFLTPHPFRGKRNEPANVRFVAEKIAQLQDVSLENVAETTTANAKTLFDW
jgi:TatD DNase family protein